MASRRLVPASLRDSLLGIPSDIGSLERNYVLPDEDLDLIATRRRPENRLGLAVHIALLRHPGQGWLDGLEPPTPLVAWLAEQVGVASEALARYAARGPTRSEHRRLAIRHLGLRAFLRAEHMRAVSLLAARAAFDTDDGGAILKGLASELRTQRFVLPSAVSSLLPQPPQGWSGRLRAAAAQLVHDRGGGLPSASACAPRSGSPAGEAWRGDPRGATGETVGPSTIHWRQDDE